MSILTLRKSSIDNACPTFLSPEWRALQCTAKLFLFFIILDLFHANNKKDLKGVSCEIIFILYHFRLLSRGY